MQLSAHDIADVYNRIIIANESFMFSEHLKFILLLLNRKRWWITKEYIFYMPDASFSPCFKNVDVRKYDIYEEK